MNKYIPLPLLWPSINTLISIPYSLSIALFCITFSITTQRSESLSFLCWYDHGMLSLSTQFLLAFQYIWLMGCSVMVYREFRNQHGWKPSTPRNSSWAAQFMKLQRRMRRISFVWIVAPVFALIACSSIASIGLFRFVVMCIMMLSDWKTSRSS